MRIKFLNIILALSLMVAGVVIPGIEAQAKDHDPVSWTVTYNGSKLESDYNTDTAALLQAKEDIKKVMPGDTVTYAATYKNDSGSSADFYVTTDVIKSLEDERDANGGAYTFEMYCTQGGSTTYLYKDDMVGGDENGLHQIKEIIEKDKDNSVKTFLKVGTLANGGAGTVYLKIKLDGNTQDSLYMDAVANINLEFGAEKTPAPKNDVITKHETITNTKRVVYTVPGATEIVAIKDPTLPLAGGGPAGGPQTGDEIIPVIACTIGLLIGILIILSYFAMEIKQGRKEVM